MRHHESEKFDVVVNVASVSSASAKLGYQSQSIDVRPAAIDPQKCKVLANHQSYSDLLDVAPEIRAGIVPELFSHHRLTPRSHMTSITDHKYHPRRDDLKLNSCVQLINKQNLRQPASLPWRRLVCWRARLCASGPGAGHPGELHRNAPDAAKKGGWVRICVSVGISISRATGTAQFDAPALGAVSPPGARA